MECTSSPHADVPWNKGKLVGPKAPRRPREVWAIRTRLQMENRTRELALFDLCIDGKLRARDLHALSRCPLRAIPDGGLRSTCVFRPADFTTRFGPSRQSTRKWP